VARHRPHILVVDYMLPDMDGVEVCRRVKEAAPGTCVVIITAFDDTLAKSAASQAGVSAFVEKFAAVGKLQQVIERLFAQGPCDA
jgi:DNA-binding NarL/FixJ family response regulator